VNNPPARSTPRSRPRTCASCWSCCTTRSCAAQEGFLATNEAKHWVKEIRHILVLLHIEFFNNLGQQALQQNQPGQARLAFERGVQYLRKQPEPKQYEEQLTYWRNC
jgi:hypothetical protein